MPDSNLTAAQLRRIADILESNSDQSGFDFYSALAAMEAEDLDGRTVNAAATDSPSGSHESFCWMVPSQSDPPGGREMLIIPRADPDKYEDMADLLFATEEDAIAWRDEELASWKETDETEQTYVRPWILCKRRITPVSSPDTTS